MAKFLIAHQITEQTEGGYVNDPDDNGGETYAGISRKFFPKWAGWSLVDSHKPLKTNQKIKDGALTEQIHHFYKENFWDKIGGDQMADQDLANQVYDMAVNSGVGSALKLLKEAQA
mgnify:CR=1 FL=1